MKYSCDVIGNAKFSSVLHDPSKIHIFAQDTFPIIINVENSCACAA